MIQQNVHPSLFVWAQGAQPSALSSFVQVRFDETFPKRSDNDLGKLDWCLPRCLAKWVCYISSLPSLGNSWPSWGHLTSANATLAPRLHSAGENPPISSSDAKITVFVSINFLMVFIFHVHLSLKINADDRDFVSNHFNQQCVGVAVMVDMTNLNLAITKDLTSVPGLHRVFHWIPVSMVSSSIEIRKISLIGHTQRVSEWFTVRFIPIHVVHLIIHLCSTWWLQLFTCLLQIRDFFYGRRPFIMFGGVSVRWWKPLPCYNRMIVSPEGESITPSLTHLFVERESGNCV